MPKLYTKVVRCCVLCGAYSREGRCTVVPDDFGLGRPIDNPNIIDPDCPLEDATGTQVRGEGMLAAIEEDTVRRAKRAVTRAMKGERDAETVQQSGE